VNIVAKFIKALNSDASPWQIAFAVMFALIVGLYAVFGVFII